MMAPIARSLLLTTAVALVSGCTSQMDMQGVDPKKYYADHPIKDTLETRDQMALVHFLPHSSILSSDEIEGLHSALHDVSPPAATVVHVQLSKADMHNEARRQFLRKQLRYMGYVHDNVRFETSPDVKPDDARIDVTYNAVVLPDCPDWRTSPVTTYSNTWQGNFKCAQETNIGLMVADPHDLVKGTGDVPPDADRDSHTLDAYHAGKDYMPGTLNAGVTGGSSGGGSGSSSGSATSSSGGATQ